MVYRLSFNSSFGQDMTHYMEKLFKCYASNIWKNYFLISYAFLSLPKSACVVNLCFIHLT